MYDPVGKFVVTHRMLKALDSLRKGPRFLSQAGMSEGTSLGVL